MVRFNRLAFVLTLVLLAGSSETSAGLMIIRDFSSVGTAPNSAIGGGNFESVVNAAADWWETTVLDDHTVTIQFGWRDMKNKLLAKHQLTHQEGAPNRETHGEINFNNQSVDWFVDPTPLDHSEWSRFTESTDDLGGGPINTGRQYTDAEGDAANGYDLFTVALHEIGHALGMSAANDAYQDRTRDGKTIEITGERPHAGTRLKTKNPAADKFDAHLHLKTALMSSKLQKAERRLPSMADILANAEISQFESVSDPAERPAVVPEPASFALVVFGGVVLLGLRRRRLV